MSVERPVINYGRHVRLAEICIIASTVARSQTCLNRAAVGITRSCMFACRHPPVAPPGGEGGSFPAWVDVQKLCNMCVPSLSVCQRGSLLDGLAMYLSCDTKKFHDNESTQILYNFWTSSHRGKLPPSPLGAPLGANKV